MTTKNITDVQFLSEFSVKPVSEPDSGMPAIEFLDFCSVDEMKEASEAAGWTIGYEQIKSGAMDARTYLAEYSDISLMDEFASRRMEMHGEPPVDHVAILAPCIGSELWANGEFVGDQQVYVVPASNEMLCLSSDNCHVLSMHVPISMLHANANDQRARSHQPVWESAKVIDLADTTSRILRRLINLCLHEPVSNAWQPERTSQLLSLLTSAVSYSEGKAAKISCKESPNTAFQTISRARDYIEAHLTRPLSMPQLAAYSSVSLSKLERSFKRDLDLTPTQYITARRLHAARRDLQQLSNVDGPVAQVAMQYGFNHLGRFSGVYKQHFGELPSETLGP